MFSLKSDHSSVSESFLGPIDFSALKSEWVRAEPFHHIVINDFLEESTAHSIVTEFPTFENKA